MSLSSTQIGYIAENLIANELMIESAGRLSAFQPVADDDGIDILFYDKITGKSVPVQIKARRNTINKPGKQERGNTVHFEVRKAAIKAGRNVALLCVLLNQDMRATERAWIIPIQKLKDIASEKKTKYTIRANKQVSSIDKYRPFQCADIAEVASRVLSWGKMCCD